MAQNYDEMIFHFFHLSPFQIIDPKRWQQNKEEMTQLSTLYHFNSIAFEKLYNSKMKKKSQRKVSINFKNRIKSIFSYV